MSPARQTYPVDLPAEHLRAVRRLAKERAVAPGDVVRLAVWSYLHVLYPELRAPPGLPPAPARRRAGGKAP